MNLLKRATFFFAISAIGFFTLVFATSVSAQKSNFKKTLRPFVMRPFRAVCSNPSTHFASCHAKFSTLTDGITPFAGVIPSSTSLTPDALHIGYQLPCTLGGVVLGSCPTPISFGPTIAIIDAYHTPNIENDLNVYSSYFGIPSCTKANGCLRVINQNGGSTLPLQVDAGWALETSLDVEIAHAICQTCKILLVEANSASYVNLGTGVNTAANLGAVAISNSYGSGEFSTEKTYDTYYNHPGVAVIASSGDSGYGAQYPAANPNVIGVGGTTLSLFTDLSYSNETVWNGTGSGCSAYEAVVFFQTNLSNWNQTGCSGMRAISDVSAVADPNTGAAVYDSTTYSGQKGWWQIGGTSLSSPIIAGVFALSGVSLNSAQTVYANASLLHDVLNGSNGSCVSVMCKAGLGYDGPTGLGTPFGLGGFGGAVVTPTPTVTPTATPTPTDSSTPTPTPSITETPTQAPTPTATPTATPTPTLTPTPPSDTTPPVVSLIKPNNNTFVFRGATILTSITATDNVKVTKVEVYVNNSLVYTFSNSPYQVNVKLPSSTGGTYVFVAKAYDAAGNSTLSNAASVRAF